MNTEKPMLEVKVDKYTIIQDSKGRVSGLRGGEPWARDLVGDNLVLAMAYEVDALREANDKLCATLKDAEMEIKTYHIDWAKFNCASPDFDPSYKPSFPKIVNEISIAIASKGATA